ncbi:MAG: hypothetical protein DMF84_21050 [Acidobacteria bacterium]|nr:MAG: hypothetical protein DMF84_21050 [Acidobacteriota bacterium]
MGRMIIGICLALAAAQAVRAQDAARPDGWVVLSIDDYRALRARAFPSPPDPAPPPVDATLSRVDYDLRVAGETVTGQARLTIDVLKQGWVTVQLPSGVLLRDARLDGRPIAIVDDDPPRVLIARSGRSTLTLDIVVPLAASTGTESMVLPASASALSAVNLVIPRAGVDLAVTGGFVADQSESASETRWRVYGSAGRPLSFSWKRKADDRRATLPLRTRARVIEVVALGEETSQVTASVRLDVTQGQARQVVVSVPPGVIVNQVAGAMVGDWTTDGGILTVALLEPATTEVSVVINAETRGPREGAVVVPLLRVPAAERENGGVAVDIVGPGEIGAPQPRGLEPADPTDLGDILAGRESASMTAFRFAPLSGASPRALTVNVTRYTPQAVLVANVEEARYDALAAEDGKVLVRARYAVRNNQRSFLGVTLPAQSVLWSASLAGGPVRPGLGATGGLLLPLHKGRAGEEAPSFVVELVYLQRAAAWSEKGNARLDLPAVDLPVSRTGLTLHYSPRYTVDAKPGAFRLATDSGPWTGTLRGYADIAGSTPAAAPAPPAGERDLQSLVDRYKKDAGRTRAGAFPITIQFPRLGPSVFLAAELTAETQPPSIGLEYRKTGGR